MIDTNRTLTEIEVALAKHDRFHYLRNIVVYNIIGWSEKLPLWHECDMLVLSKAGYLTEIEIKRSWRDFLADFKKTHSHKDLGGGMVKCFFYCVPECIKDKCEQKIAELGVECSGVITYTEDLYIKVPSSFKLMKKYRKLTPEEQFTVARLGAVRVISLKNKLIKQNK